MKPVFRYKRVTVHPGKHGKGDYRISFNGSAPTHSEFVAMLWWVWEAEDRYTKGLGRHMLRMHLDRAFYKDVDLPTILRDIDGDDG